MTREFLQKNLYTASNSWYKGSFAEARQVITGQFPDDR